MKTFVGTVGFMIVVGSQEAKSNVTKLALIFIGLFVVTVAAVVP